jgi:hypothetical protein
MILVKTNHHYLMVGCHNIDLNCNEHFTFILPRQERAINRQHITTMIECFNALSKDLKCTNEILSTLWPHNISFGDVLEMYS